MENGYISLPEVPGIGLESKASLAPILSQLQ